MIRGVLPPWEGRPLTADRDTTGAEVDMGEALGLIVMWVTGSGVRAGIAPVDMATLTSRETRRPRHGKR